MSRAGPSFNLATDAPNEGRGAVTLHSSTGGLWSAHEKQLHINCLELLVVFLELQACFQKHHDSRHVIGLMI